MNVVLVVAVLATTAVAAVTLFTAWRHDWDGPATIAALGAAGVAAWQAVQAIWGG